MISISRADRSHRAQAKFGILFASLLLGIICYSLPSAAQLNLGRIFGTVTDQSGGAIAGAMVTVLDVERGVSRPLVADDAGEYSAPSLTPGTYTVRAESKGFKRGAAASPSAWGKIFARTSRCSPANRPRRSR